MLIIDSYLYSMLHARWDNLAPGAVVPARNWYEKPGASGDMNNRGQTGILSAWRI